MEISKKPGESTRTGSKPRDSSWPRSVTDEEREEIWAFWRERFGVPQAALDRYSLWERGGTYWALSGMRPFPQSLCGMKAVTVGLPMVRRLPKGLKPTTCALRLLAKWIERNRILLSELEAHALLERGELGRPYDLSPGYVLLEIDAGVLGCGLVGRGRLLSQIPKKDVVPIKVRHA